MLLIPQHHQHTDCSHNQFLPSQARDVYEEALRSVMTVRDFTQVFDSYAQFEELMLKRRMEEVGSEEDQQDETDIELRYLLLVVFSVLCFL